MIRTSQPDSSAEEALTQLVPHPCCSFFANIPLRVIRPQHGQPVIAAKVNPGVLNSIRAP
jgi:hypothetical protein